jgi:hypothetical protein
MKDPQAKNWAHVHHGGPRIGLGRLHRMNLWLLKRRHHYPTSSGRGSHQIIPITCHQVTTTPTICPKAIQVIITLSCHLILLRFRSSSAIPWFVPIFQRNSSYSVAQFVKIFSNIQAEATSLRPESFEIRVYADIFIDKIAANTNSGCKF